MNIDDSTRIQTFFRQKTHFGVGKLLTISRGYKDRARERTSVYQEGAVLPLTFNCILRNNGTFHRFKKCHDEWIGEHSKLFELGLLSLNVVFRKFFIQKGCDAPWVLRLMAIKRVCDQRQMRFVEIVGEIPITVEVTYLLASQLETLKHFNQTVFGE